MNAITASEFRSLLSAGNCPLPKSAVAVSGGADSIALAFLLRECFQVEKWPALYAFTVNHALRPESVAEAQAVHSLLTSIGIHHEVLEIPPLLGSGIENKARQARYSALTQACLRHQVYDLYLAHHADDQAETVLLRLIGGSRWRGLVGMQKRTYNPVSSLIHDADRIRLLRPLITVPKKRLVATCVDRQIAWSEDSTNHDPKHTVRNAIRHIAQSPGALPQALRTPELLRLSQDCSARLEDLRKEKVVLAREIQPCLCHSTCSVRFSIAPVCSRFSWKELQMSLLGDLCAIVSPAESVSEDTMDNVLSLLLKHYNDISVTQTITAGGALWCCDSGQCIVFRQPCPKTQLDAATIHVKQQDCVDNEIAVLFDRRFHLRFKNLPQDITIRFLRKSDMFMVRQRMTTQTQDTTVEELLKVAKGQVRFTLPAIFASISGELLVVPSLGLRSATFAAFSCTLAKAHLWERLSHSL